MCIRDSYVHFNRGDMDKAEEAYLGALVYNSCLLYTSGLRFWLDGVRPVEHERAYGKIVFPFGFCHVGLFLHFWGSEPSRHHYSDAREMCIRDRTGPWFASIARGPMGMRGGVVRNARIYSITPTRGWTTVPWEREKPPARNAPSTVTAPRNATLCAAS